MKIDMIIFKNKKDCCGCGVCALSCPLGCIRMVKDDEGFSYPEIDHNICNDCGICKASCDFQNVKPSAEKDRTPLIYAAKHKNDDVRMESSSGGAFTVLSDWILQNGGVVFGVKFDENLTALTAYAADTAGRDEFRGSKYMQSELANSFYEVKEFLNAGRLVMFSGTPCQTAALKHYCKDVDTRNLRNLRNLYLCDFICHGVPPQKLFKDYLEYLEAKKNVKFISCKMRDKKIDGWKCSTQTDTLTTAEGKEIRTHIYMKLFIDNFMLRPCCYYCKHTTYERTSDLTIADFWGIEKCMPDFFDDKGVSLILVNSEQGKRLFDETKNDFDLRLSNKNDCSQKQLYEPSDLPPEREDFLRDYQTKGFEYIAKKYGGNNLGYKCKIKIKNIVKIVLIKLGLLDFAKSVLKR